MYGAWARRCVGRVLVTGTMHRALALLFFVVACSSTPSQLASFDAGAAQDAAAEAAPAAPFELKSTAFEEGTDLPARFTCNGTNVSPPLAWGPGPAGTLSYALVVNDTTFKFLHSVMVDIPASTLALPENVQKKSQPAEPAGSRQVKSYSGTFGYAGPCPPKPEEHVYEFVLYALSVETLPAVTETSTLKATEAEVKKNALGEVRLTVKYKQP
jgi:Raf kinase inhibitor-like YbhB/YbcL family protein